MARSTTVTLKLLPGASEAEVIKQLDDLLARYGGIGAYGRKDQLSHAFLDAELRQLDALRRVMPPIFLLVSAFLINITLSRIIALEREQIGLLKALGYGPLPIATHYIKMVLAITAVGICIGFVAGAWLGKGLTRLYGDFFHFPFLLFRHDADIYAIAGLVSALAAVAGALKAVREVLVLAPAVAMQPPAPTRYRRLFVTERRTVGAVFAADRDVASPHGAPPGAGRRDLARHCYGRRPAGDGAAVLRLRRANDRGCVLPHRPAARDRDTSPTRSTPVPCRSIERLPGVLRAEPYRSTSVRLSNEHLSRQLSIIGKPRDMDLSRVLDLDDRPVDLPASGLVINERVARAPAPAARRPGGGRDSSKGRRGTALRYRWPTSSRATSA